MEKSVISDIEKEKNRNVLQEKKIIHESTVI